MELLSEIVFWCFVVLTVGSALMVVFHKKIIYSAFGLLFTFLGVAALYFFLAADFLAVSQLLIYVGAILVLIIFGVFMTAKIQSSDVPQQKHQRILAFVPAILGAIALGYMIFQTQWQINILPVEPTTKEIGRLLLTDYLVPFEAASVLLLAALIGAMRMVRFYRHEQEEE